MPSSCPKCHAVLEEDEICCAQVRYTWKCARCHKLSEGFALPYGKCFLCGGNLAVLEGRELGDPLRFHAIREAVQFELNAFHFYKLARDRATNPTVRAVLERMFEMELDHVHELEERYHAHLDPRVLDLNPSAEKLLSDWLFRDIRLDDHTGMRGLYEAAIAMEKRTRDHFRSMAAGLPEGLERELCLELAAEEEEHVAILETELDQIS
jgi:rubrerythrin